MAADPLATSQPEPASPPPPAPTIHEAELEPGTSGRVLRGPAIDVDTAVARRRAGQNVVVCGEDQDANRRLANRLESTVGPSQRGDPHIRHAGPHALPHYQQTRRS